MQGFIRRRIPLLLRRGLTMLPALVVLALGPAGHREPDRLAGRAVLRDPVRAGAAGAAHPAPGRHGHASSTSAITTVALGTVAALIIALNVVLLWETFL